MRGLGRRIIAGATAAGLAFGPVGGATARLAEAAEQRKIAYFHPDHLGSTSLVTDETGQVVARRAYRPFGATAAQTLDPGAGAAATAHGFTGQRRDDSTALYFYHARYYDPALGRFLQPDQILQSPRDPQALNRYSYARNNPLILVDPTGHFFWVPLFFAVAKVAAAVSLGSTIGGVIAASTGHDRAAGVFSKIAGVSGVIGGFSGGFSAFNVLTASVSAASVGLGFSSSPDAQQASRILSWTAVGLQAGRGAYDYFSDKGQILTPSGRPGAFNELMEQGGKLRVHGIMNTQQHAQALANARNSAVFHQSSHGLIADLTEAALQKFLGPFVPSAAERNLSDIISMMQKRVIIIGHSQGGIITANSLLHLGRALPSGSSVIFEGAQLSQPRALLSAAVAGISRTSFAFNMNFFDPSSLAGPSIDPFKLFGGAIGAAIPPLGLKAHAQTSEF